MKKKIFALLCIVTLLSVFCLSVSADLGPKPSVIVEFDNMGDELCYGTLLSGDKANGPYSAWDGDEEHIYNEGVDVDIWRKFAEYQDQDGFVFLQIGWHLGKDHVIDWTYYPPSVFKILLYYPETDTFVVSGIYESYAFDSYFTVDMANVKTGEMLVATSTYDYGAEIGGLMVRIIATIVIEMLVALIFGFVEKKQLLLLICANSATQIILNVLLNVINYRSGGYALVFYYVLFELLVFAIEAVLYSILLKKISQNPKNTWVYVVYALVANAVSFITGMYALSLMMPMAF